jgi:dTDP-4-dehydrorhamnose reductase
MKIAVIGGNGQLGTDVCRAFAVAGDEVCCLTHSDLEIADRASVCRTICDVAPTVVVNTAAMHHVDRCEENPERAYLVNGLGARNLAIASRETGAIFMHVSTDYVFDGDKASPYEESDAPRPLSAYGNTKLAGEYFVRSATERHFVVRTSALYGATACRAKGRNFVELMLNLARERGEVRVVDSEFVTPTFTGELARQLLVLSRSQAYGLYHATAEGSCSWYEFAREIFQLTGTQVALKVAAGNEFPAKVSRPPYSVLENRGLKSIGLNVFRPWREGLCEYLQATPACVKG